MKPTRKGFKTVTLAQGPGAGPNRASGGLVVASDSSVRPIGIYSYRAISKNILRELMNGEVRYSKFSGLNDPCENLYINRSTQSPLSALSLCLAPPSGRPPPLHSLPPVRNHAYRYILPITKPKNT